MESDFYIVEREMSFLRSFRGRAVVSKSVEKAINILELLAKKQGSVSLTELSSCLSYPPSTAHRLLNTLISRNYVRKDDNGLYVIGYGILRLQALLQQNVLLEQLARPVLTELEERTGMTTNLAIRDGLKAVIISIIKGSRNLVVNNNLGKYVSIHASSVGKCLLAFLPRDKQEQLVTQLVLKEYTSMTITDAKELLQELEITRKRGYGVDNEEFVSGIRCIGAPVFNSNNEAIAAISVSGLAPQIQGEGIDAYATKVIHAARAISALVYGSEPIPDVRQRTANNG